MGTAEGKETPFLRKEINKDLESLIEDVYQQIGAGRWANRGRCS